MRIINISDTHNRHQYIPQLPDADVLIHAGDATGMGTTAEIEQFANWLNALPIKHKIYVPGNHDWGFQRDFVKHEALFVGVQVLHERSIEIDGVKFYGAAWQPEFCNWAFNVPRGPESAANWARIPDDVNVLITHGPPFGTLDLIHIGGTMRIENVGCEELAKRITDLKDLKLHVFGHIHDSHGHITKDGVTYINASFLNDSYVPAYGPIVVDI